MTSKIYDYNKIIDILHDCEVVARDVTEALILISQGANIVKIRDININNIYQQQGTSINYYVDILNNFKVEGRLLSNLKIRRSNQKKIQLLQQPKFWPCGYNTLFKIGALDLLPTTTCDAYILGPLHRSKYLQNEANLSEKIISMML